MFQRMLVPLDGSAQADRILPYACGLAKSLHIPILLLSIVDLRVASSARGRGDVEQQLQRAVDRLHHEGVQATMAITAGRPAEEILGVAESQGCDLIVLSTSTRQSTGRGTLGRVTDKVFHASQIPLLLLPPWPLSRPRLYPRPRPHSSFPWMAPPSLKPLYRSLKTWRND